MKSKAILLASMMLMVEAAMANPKVSWSASSEGSGSIRLGESAQKIELRGGWSCLIGKTSNMLPLYEARQTTCQKGDSAFEFSVQCEASREKDHSQVRLRDHSGILVDYIDVVCELSK